MPKNSLEEFIYTLIFYPTSNVSSTFFPENQLHSWFQTISYYSVPFGRFTHGTGCTYQNLKFDIMMKLFLPFLNPLLLDPPLVVASHLWIFPVYGYYLSPVNIIRVIIPFARNDSIQKILTLGTKLSNFCLPLFSNSSAI